MKVTQPSSDVPQKWAAFSGTWEGAWIANKTGKRAAPMMYVVEKIDPDGKAIIVYSWANYPKWKWKGSWERNAASFEGEVLVFENRNGKYTQKILENGKMRSDFAGKFNGVGKLKKTDWRYSERFVASAHRTFSPSQPRGSLDLGPLASLPVEMEGRVQIVAPRNGGRGHAA